MSCEAPKVTCLLDFIPWLGRLTAQRLAPPRSVGCRATLLLPSLGPTPTGRTQRLLPDNQETFARSGQRAALGALDPRLLAHATDPLVRTGWASSQPCRSSGSRTAAGRRRRDHGTATGRVRPWQDRRSGYRRRKAFPASRSLSTHVQLRSGLLIRVPGTLLRLDQRRIAEPPCGGAEGQRPPPSCSSRVAARRPWEVPREGHSDPGSPHPWRPTGSHVQCSVGGFTMRSTITQRADLRTPARQTSPPPFRYLRPSFFPAASNAIDSRIRLSRVSARLAV